MLPRVQVRDVLFEPVRKTQDAMHFKQMTQPGTSDVIFMPCGPREPGAIQTSLEELSAKGLDAKVCYCAVLFFTGTYLTGQYSTLLHWSVFEVPTEHKGPTGTL